MSDRTRWMPRWLLPALLLAVGAPLLAAATFQHDADWHPVFDLAMTELRVRDVGGPDTPLIGLQGRIGPTGSHPGPLSFYLLAPVYRLVGSSAFALQVSTAVFHGAAAVTALLVVRRRRHGWALVGVAALLLFLMIGYGLGPLTEPWNPHLPVLWFVAFLVSGWAVLDDDLPMLLPMVAAGSICAQTHVPYLAVTLAVGLGVLGLAALRTWQRRAAPTSSWRWFALAGGLGVLLWLPPLIDEAVHEPGNLSQIVDHLGTPEEEPIGIREATGFVLERFDAWQLVVVEPQHPGTYVHVLSGPGPREGRGLVTLALWAASVVAAVLIRHRRLLALHAVVGGSALAAVLAVSRIHGVPWPYLMQWAFGIGALMLFAVGATAAVLAMRRWPGLRTERSVALVGSVGVALVAVLSLRLLGLAPDAAADTPDETAQLGRLVDPTVDALDADAGAATGDDGRYKVVWYDATHGGSEGIGMVNELVRRGYDVGVDERDRVRIGPHRVRADGDATARIVVASGGWIDVIGAEPGAERVAYDDPRTAEERREFDDVRDQAAAALEQAGRGDLVEHLDTDLFQVALNEGIDPGIALLVGRMLDIGVPTAVFVLPGGDA